MGRTLFAFASLVAFAALQPACGGAPAPAATTPAQEAPKPKPRNAAAIAKAVAGGQVDVLVFANRVRNHPLGPKLAGLDLFRPILDGTGLDPQKDLERAYAAAPSARDEGGTVFVAEHSLPEARTRAAVEALIAKSRPSGGWIDGLGVPAARVTIQNRPRVVALVEPNVLVVLPEKLAGEAKKFVGTGGCPDPEGPEAAVATALDPGRTLEARHAPEIPKTVKSGRATITLTPDGGADLTMDGESTTPDQARADAEAMMKEQDRVTSLRVSIIKVRMFDPIVLKTEGTKISGKRHLTAAEVDRILGLISAVVPR